MKCIEPGVCTCSVKIYWVNSLTLISRVIPPTWNLEASEFFKLVPNGKLLFSLLGQEERSGEGGEEGHMHLFIILVNAPGSPGEVRRVRKEVG